MGITANFGVADTANAPTAGVLGTYRYVKGDTGPQLRLSFTDEDTGRRADLTNATVTLHMRAQGDTTVLLSRELFINPETAEDGVALVVWEEGDLDQTPGVYQGEIEIVRGSGVRETLFDVLVFQIRGEFA